MVDFSKPTGCEYSDCELSIITTIGGENLVAYPTLNMPIQLNSEEWATQLGDLICIDPYFFEKPKLIQFTPNIFIAFDYLQLDTLLMTLIPHSPRSLVHNLGRHNFVACFTNISVYDHTTQTNQHYNFQSNCTFIANTMNITFNGKIHYTNFDTKNFSILFP